MEQGQLFDEKAKLGLDLLFHHYWILRSENPEWYQLIREREKVIRRYITEKFGLRLTVHQQFIKLEKIPVKPEQWMGIQKFQEPLDYAIFCCALSFLEGKSVEEQFLLSELCQEIQNAYPNATLDWTLYVHRKSLIRVIQVMMEFHLLQEIDGDITRFDYHEDHEVLYEATTFSRYFLRTFPEDFSSYQHWNELLKDDWKHNQEDERRKRVYRKLFFSPGIHRVDKEDLDFLYIRNYRNRLIEDIEQHSDYELHVFKNTAFLSIAEPRQFHQTFPNMKAVSDIILQISKEIHDNPEKYTPSDMGEIVLTNGEFEAFIESLRDNYGKGWSKHFRDSSTMSICAEVIQEMKDWMMVEKNEETNLIYIKSLTGVLAGKYPDDYEEGK